MKKLNNPAFLFIIFMLSSNFYAEAQNSFTLTQCIDYAIKNQTRVKASKLEEQLQIEKNKEVVALTRPQVNATAQFQYLFILPKQRADANAFDFSSSLSFFKIDTPAYIAFQQKPKAKYSELQFGLPINVSAGVTASQILFDAGIFVALKARKTLEDLTVISTKRTEEDVRVAVSKAYYSCVIANKRIKLLDENIKLLSSIENTTSKLHKEGFAERIDVDRLTVQLNNLTIEKQKIMNLIELSYALLKFQMGMPLAENVELVDKLDIEEVKQGLELDRVVDYNNRVEMDLMKMGKLLNELDLERYKKAYLPTVAAAVSTSVASQTKSIPDLFKYSFFPTGALVLNASMPIYNGNSRKAKMNQVKLNLLKNENDMNSFKQAVDLESSNARTQLKNTLISLENQEANIKLAQKVYDIAQKKYKEGVGTNIEIIQAETALKESQTNFFNTLYEAVIAKIDFQKSLGILNK